MTDCERLSDRMPEVALGRAVWTPEEAAHLAGCAECRAEWGLVQGVRRLEAGAPVVDVEAIASAVERRLARERAGRRGRWLWTAGSAAAAAAAAAAIVIGVDGRSERGVEVGAPIAAVEPLVPLPELDGLETAQLDTLLRTMDGSLVDGAGTDSTAPSDDVDVELEWLLATWEG